ncbi:hypothetical protein [Streptomyces sp. AK04-3B]|uniref:hypothetical protein n=1 Tax=Streptomyces sp. AK04-3B TaxID=3028650 RepID=UPI0029A3421E|nr:hypothetical protein [Streptomyces sp. AK04-3B]MDX3803652.1 hypothetical protein [Streptomyces sp. AK04-3B]
MRARRPLTLILLLFVAVLTGACAAEREEPDESGNGKSNSASPPPTWDGKEDAEEAMQSAARALNAVESRSVFREDSGTTTLAKGLNRTLTTQGQRPYTFDISCQTPSAHTLTLTLMRGDAVNEWDVECGDREADQFNIPAGTPITARITPANGGNEGIISWRLNSIAAEDVQDCADDITGCGS